MDSNQNSESPNRAGRNLLRHLNTVSASLNRTLTQVQSDPRRASDLGEELGRTFRLNVEQCNRDRSRNSRSRSRRNTTTSTTESGTDRRRSRDLAMHLFCLQDPSVTRTNTDLQMDYLTSIGLGVPYAERRNCNLGRGRQKTKLQLSWTPDELRDFIINQFPPLRGHSYELLYSVVGGSLKTFPTEINTPDRIKVFLDDIRRSPGTLFIRPNDFLTATGLVQNQDIRQVEEEEEEEEEEVERLQKEQNEIIEDQDKREEERLEKEQNEIELGEEGLPVIDIPTRRRRRAAEVAISNIHGWCGNRATGNTVIQENTRSSTRPLISGNVVDNQGLTLTQIRSMQDEEYLASLNADRQKDQDKREEEEKLAKEQNEMIELEEIIKRRKRNLPVEPETGFILKLRTGERRRFRQTDSVQILIEFVGSQPFSTKGFEIIVVGTEKKISSWTSSGNLADFGIRHSAVVEVMWNVDEPTTTIPIIRTYEDLITSTYTDNFDVDDDLYDVVEDEHQDQDQDQDTAGRLASVRQGEDVHVDVRELLQTWKIKEIDLDNFQKIVVSRQPRSLWEHSLRCFNRENFKLNQTLKVEFRNECGEDEGGLRREYLEILLRQMLKSSYFEEIEDSGYEVSFNMIGLIEGTYKTIGKMLATIIVQGGAFTPLLSHAMVSYGYMGQEAASLETVNSEKRAIIQKIETEADVEILNQDEAVQNILESAGINLRISATSKRTISKALIAYFSRVTSKKAILDQFWEGAEQIGLQTLLKSNTANIRKILCKCCSVPQELTGDMFMEMCVVKSFGERGSNMRQQSEDVAQNFESFVFDCQEGKCQYTDGVVHLCDILQFLTGCSSIPPGGFDNKFTVNFTDVKCYPSVSTCTLDLTLPIHLVNYKNFHDVMIEAIVSGPGFGLI
ncbi:G2H3 [Mytilus coruscus]|uniref:G2H3 n=1 Tax=Mytilus coruscus TaxID=42192 RepID=A0A6J8EN67_MYTCO|nr:G2H3 [Mytilus coruscus]